MRLYAYIILGAYFWVHMCRYVDFIAMQEKQHRTQHHPVSRYDSKDDGGFSVQATQSVNSV
jgi:hypothetical protein